MSNQQPNNPLHGITLKMMVTRLVEHYGWKEMGRRIEIRCFMFDPSMNSSLKFLRRNDWARQQVEELYLVTPGLTSQEVPVREKSAPEKLALEKAAPQDDESVPPATEKESLKKSTSKFNWQDAFSKRSTEPER